MVFGRYFSTHAVSLHQKISVTRSRCETTVTDAVSRDLRSR